MPYDMIELIEKLKIELTNNNKSLKALARASSFVICLIPAKFYLWS